MTSLIPSMNTTKEVAFDSVPTTGGVMAMAFAASKLFGEKFGITISVNGFVMLAIAVFLGNLLVNLAQRNKWVREDL